MSLSVLVLTLVFSSPHLFFPFSSSPIHPSLPILIISHFHFSPSPPLPFICLSPPHPHRHPSLPILIALHTGGHREAGLPAGWIVSTSFIVRSEYKEENRERITETFVSLPAGFTSTNRVCSEEIKDTLLNSSGSDAHVQRMRHFELMKAAGVTRPATVIRRHNA